MRKQNKSHIQLLILFSFYKHKSKYILKIKGLVLKDMLHITHCLSRQSLKLTYLI